MTRATSVFECSLRIRIQRCRQSTCLFFDLEHLAAPTAGIERADDAVAHLVACGQLRVGIPDATTDDLVAQRSRDFERGRNLALLNAGLRTPADLANIVPDQLRCAACRLVQEFARLEEP